MTGGYFAIMATENNVNMLTKWYSMQPNKDHRLHYWIKGSLTEEPKPLPDSRTVSSTTQHGKSATTTTTTTGGNTGTVSRRESLHRGAKPTQSTTLSSTY